MAIIGNGNIASVLPDTDDLLFFASGVSNSKETDEKEYEREINLLLAQPKDVHIVYFSSLAVFTASNTRYIQHKHFMEILIKEHFPVYTIIRIGNALWDSNPNTFINYLRTHPEAKIKDEYRYIVDREEFLFWINLIPRWSAEMNVVGKRLLVKDVMKELSNGN